MLKKYSNKKSEIVGTLFLECNYTIINIELVVTKNCKIATHLFIFNEKTAKFCKISQNFSQINNMCQNIEEIHELHFVLFSIDQFNKKVELIGMNCDLVLLNKYYDRLKFEIKNIFNFALKENTSSYSIKNSVYFVNFFDKINERFNKVFERGKDEILLNNMFPNSKWKRIISNGNYFVLGCLFDNEKICAIGIGQPVVSRNKVSTTLTQVTRFYPARQNCSDGFGYYLGFKDAMTGKNINLSL